MNEDYLNPTLEGLRREFAQPGQCHCTGACMVDGVQGPCPLGDPPGFTLADHIGRLIDFQDAFGTAPSRVNGLKKALEELKAERAT